MNDVFAVNLESQQHLTRWIADKLPPGVEPTMDNLEKEYGKNPGLAKLSKIHYLEDRINAGEDW